MAWTTPRTWVANAVLAAAQLNTDIRDNLLYLKGLLDGTGTDTVTVPSTLFFFNDAQFFASRDIVGPYFRFDTGDYIQYDRTNNRYDIYIGSVLVARLDGAGFLTGALVYNSGIFAIGAGATVDLNPFAGDAAHAGHPRWFTGYYAVATQTLELNVNIPCGVGPASTEKVKVTLAASGDLRVVSTDAVANSCIIYAIK